MKLKMQQRINQRRRQQRNIQAHLKRCEYMVGNDQLNLEQKRQVTYAESEAQ